ncbi:MAG: ABC transporter permease [Lachnospiraceae bacterium]|nr:ABC transporter permease [Lachnospiraceae bacterium]MDO5549702.1 ABC transporter permease [Lachnospiraceae bacterium]
MGNKKAKKRSMAAEIIQRLVRNKMAMLGLFILVLLALGAIFADVIADYDTKVVAQNIANRLQGPSAEHWFGTDEFGRDIFARMLHGSRVSLVVGLISVSVSLIIGGTLGAFAGFYGGKVDNVIMRIMDIFLAVPSILLAITIVAALGTNLVNVMLAIGISGVPNFARIVRAAVMSVKDQEFVESSRAIGASSVTIIFREIIPNCMAPIIVQATLSVASAILSTASLSFIGLGVQPPDPEWGAMLSSGRNFLRDAVHLTLFPGLAIVITILALNLLGDGLRDALDPRLKQ